MRLVHLVALIESYAIRRGHGTKAPRYRLLRAEYDSGIAGVGKSSLRM